MQIEAAVAGAQIELMAFDHGDHTRLQPVERQVEAAIDSRRGAENECAVADRQRRRPAAIAQADLVLGAQPLAERKHALPLTDRHPAEGLPWRMRLSARRRLLLVEDRRYR